MDLAAVLIALCLGADAKVSAVQSAVAGDYVLIDASESKGTLTWSVTTPDAKLFVATNSKQALLYCPTAKLCRFSLTATDAAGTSICRDVIEFTSDSPQPEPAPAPMPPAPLPGPPPMPKKLPDGKFALAQPCCDQACQVQAAKRKAEAEALAEKLTGIRDRIKSGEIDTSKPAELMLAIQRANKSLPDDVQRRWSAWGTWWGRSLHGIYVAGKLANEADWITVIEETILGLKAVM